MPFFVGTGGTNISFSFSSAVSFFKDAVLSIFQINSGPEYLTGIQFTALKGFYLIFTLLVTCSILAIFTIYLLSIRKAFTLNQEDQKSKFFIFLFLIILFVFCLIPAISTIRLEQRWLMASFSIFVIMIVIALSGLQFKSVHTKNAILLSFVICFLYSDYNYFHKGIANLYMTDAQKTAATFKKAVNNHTIHPNTTKLYIWEKHLDINSNNALNWALGEGYLFNFYQNQSKEIFFADSIYHKQGDSVVSSFPNFNKDSTQILYVNDSITDITDQYLKDSLKSWKE